MLTRGVFALGLLYAFLLIPASIRPQWSAHPTYKPLTDVTVVSGAPDAYSRIKHACTAPLLLRPIMGPAKSVQLTTVDAEGAALSVKKLSCKAYV